MASFQQLTKCGALTNTVGAARRQNGHDHFIFVVYLRFLAVNGKDDAPCNPNYLSVYIPSKTIKVSDSTLAGESLDIKP